ncbi:cysteine-rich CWC family protein [Methylibium sp.]|uniref:cysteine-rich CWC family protein n=1 Tax=Methylibium sp. TaxID=2067992 RepID=UPI003D098C01
MASEDRQDPRRGGLSTAPLRTVDCPVCGGPNACAVAAVGSFDVDCWCRRVRIDPATLASLPPAQRGTACLCRGCAEAPESAVTTAPGRQR